mmetsp:Transcript_19534/g.52648  ORF Transcript_19534/g.52648 Transcript_19534/m.52648 type:complete len:275 (-) Transcript_19534:185-1009(-)
MLLCGCPEGRREAELRALPRCVRVHGVQGLLAVLVVAHVLHTRVEFCSESPVGGAGLSLEKHPPRCLGLIHLPFAVARAHKLTCGLTCVCQLLVECHILALVGVDTRTKTQPRRGCVDSREGAACPRLTGIVVIQHCKVLGVVACIKRRRLLAGARARAVGRHLLEDTDAVGPGARRTVPRGGPLAAPATVGCDSRVMHLLTPRLALFHCHTLVALKLHVVLLVVLRARPRHVLRMQAEPLKVRLGLLGGPCAACRVSVSLARREHPREAHGHG